MTSKRQKGNIRDIVTIILYMLLAAGVASVIAFLPSLRNGQALNEVTMLSAQMQRAANVADPSDLNNFEGFVDEGYIDSETYEDGVGENYFGNDVTGVTATSTGIVTMTYITNDVEQCAYLKNEIKRQNRRLATAPACTATTLTLKLTPGI